MNAAIETVDGVQVALPPRIDREVRRYLGYLRESAEALARGRMADRLSGGAGRSEAECWESVAATVVSYRELLGEFHSLASLKGIDADAAIIERGGTGDLWITPAAYEWLKPKDQAAVQRYATVSVGNGVAR